MGRRGVKDVACAGSVDRFRVRLFRVALRLAVECGDHGGSHARPRPPGSSPPSFSSRSSSWCEASSPAPSERPARWRRCARGAGVFRVLAEARRRSRSSGVEWVARFFWREAARAYGEMRAFEALNPQDAAAFDEIRRAPRVALDRVGHRRGAQSTRDRGRRDPARAERRPRHGRAPRRGGRRVRGAGPHHPSGVDVRHRALSPRLVDADGRRGPHRGRPRAREAEHWRRAETDAGQLEGDESVRLATRFAQEAHRAEVQMAGAPGGAAGGGARCGGRGPRNGLEHSGAVRTTARSAAGGLGSSAPVARGRADDSPAPGARHSRAVPRELAAAVRGQPRRRSILSDDAVEDDLTVRDSGRGRRPASSERTRCPRCPSG
jgi:hypothetical protein